MRDAEEKLKKAKREGAVKDQEEALKELKQAKAELEEILRQLREKEIERMLAMLEARFKDMLKLQRVVYDGTVRLGNIPEAERTHSHDIEASRLSSKEVAIVVIADKALALLLEDGTAVAFTEATRQIREDMEQVVQRLAQTKVGDTTQGIELDIIAALEEMIEALQKAQKDMEDKKQPPGKSPPGQPQDPPLVDLLAEIKMIRAMQMRINRRSERYRKLVEGDKSTENPELKEALRRLAEREERCEKITRDIGMGRNR